MQMPFFPAWLAARDFSAREIGLVLAAPLLLRVVGVPAWTRMVDRFSLLPGALRLASVVAACGFVITGSVRGFAAVLISYAVGAMALSDDFPAPGCLRPWRA